MAKLGVVTRSIERGWAVIRTVHQEVRPAVLVVYLHPSGARRGHYWQEAWTARDLGLVDEVHISSAVLAEGAPSVWRTLLHEATHSLAVARGIKDTSRDGRYHNKRFAALAAELGLITASDPTVGVLTPAYTEQAEDRYRNAITDLAECIEVWQSWLRPGALGKPKAKGRNLRLQCPSCRRLLRASNRTVKMGGILCVPCDRLFRVAEKP